MTMVRWRYRDVFTGKKSADLLFFGQLCLALRVQLFHGLYLFLSNLWKMADEMDQFPAVFIGFAFLIFSESRHSRESDSVVNDEINFPVRQLLSTGEAHVRRLG